MIPTIHSAARPLDGGVPHGPAKSVAAARWPALVVFIIGCMLTLYMWSGLRAFVEQRADERFGTDVRKLAEQVESRMQIYAALLAAGAGLLEASEDVDAAEWKLFTESLHLRERYPGIQGYGFSARVPSPERSKFEARQRHAHGPGFHVWPESERDEVHSIVYLEPQDERNRLALGFDMYSEPVRRAAMERAIETRAAQLSAPVRLVQEGPSVRPQPGILMYYPVFRQFGAASREPKGGSRLLGFVYAPFRVHDLLDGLVGTQPPAFRFSLIDRGGIGGTEEVLFEHQGSSPRGGVRGEGALLRNRGFAVAGRVWNIKATAPRDYGAIDSGLQEAGLLVGGGALSLLLAFIVHMLMRTRDRAVTLAERMTADLEASRRRFERIVAGTTDGAWEHDVISQKSFLSPRFREILGFDAVEVMVEGKWVADRLHPDDRRVVVKAFMAMLTDGRVFDQRMRMRMADDSYRWFRVRGRIFSDGLTQIAAGSMSDVNDEQDARFREARLVKVVEMSPDLFMTFDLEGRATYLNAAARRIFGEIASDSLAGFSVAGMFSQSEVDRVFNEGVPTAYMEDYWQGETELITAAGEVMPVSQVILSHKNEAGQVEFYSTVMRDISERRLSMQALTEAQERLQRALDGSSDGIWERDVRTDAFSSSERLAQILGYTPEEMPRTRIGWRALNHPDDLWISDAAVARLNSSNESVVWDTRMRTRSGEYRWMRRRGRMVRDADGNPLLSAGTLTDIHEAKMAEVALQELQARYQRAIDGSNDGMWERDLRADVFTFSERLAAILGYRLDQMPRDLEGWRELFHPEDLPIRDAQVERMLKHAEPMVADVRMRTAAGDYRWVRLRGRTVRDAEGIPTSNAGTLTDIHESKMAEAELRDLQARYQRALDGTNDGIWEMDEVTRRFTCSARFCELVGWASEQAPRSRDDMRDLIHPQDLPHHIASVSTMQAKTSAHSWDVRFRNDEGGYRWVRFRGIASRAPDGRLLLTSGTISDIQDARLAEIELRQHRDNLARLVDERTAGLEQARLDAEASREAAERANLAKSEFLANMSHELRTPMHAIISFANFGVDKFDRAERDKLLHYFRNIQKSGSRLLSLLNDLLDLSKLEAGRMDMTMGPSNAATLLADAIGEAEAFAQNRKVHLTLDADPSRLGVVWDGPRVLQVIRNLISNAVKFSLADGTVAISAHPVHLPAGRRSGDPRVPGVEIRVSDAGIGIPEDELESVFDKFVQSSKTKTGAGGTGLGLAICREIVLAHQGSIRAENNPAPGPGATFVVVLPVSPVSARIPRGNGATDVNERVEEVK